MINYDEVRLALRHIWTGTLDIDKVRLALRHIWTGTLEVFCNNTQGRVDQGVRMYLIIEKEREVATTQKMMKKLLQGKFKAPELEVVASEKRLVKNNNSNNRREINK